MPSPKYYSIVCPSGPLNMPLQSTASAYMRYNRSNHAHKRVARLTRRVSLQALYFLETFDPNYSLCANFTAGPLKWCCRMAIAIVSGVLALVELTRLKASAWLCFRTTPSGVHFLLPKPVSCTNCPNGDLNRYQLSPNNNGSSEASHTASCNPCESACLTSSCRLQASLVILTRLY